MLKQKRTKRLLSLSALLLSFCNNAYTDNQAKEIYLTSCVNGGVCSTEQKNIRLEDKVNLNLVLQAVNERGEEIYFSNSDNLRINNQRLDPLNVKKWGSEDINIKWFKVESREDSYSNIGWENFMWDTPTYKETLVDEGKNWQITADAHPTDESKDINKGLGTMRYKVEVRYNGKKISSPGKESTNSKGIEDKVHRISFRKDNSFVGWLTSYFNLPYIYASSGKNNKQIKQ